MLWIIAIINFIYAPMMVFLRNPPGKEEKQVMTRRLSWNISFVRYSNNTVIPFGVEKPKKTRLV